MTEISTLAPYACDPSQTRGRRHPEAPAPTRTDYQRDRDRIVHSTAFRRLVYKTQVFLNHEGDLFRTRLTHSLEVAQLGRSVARSLRLNEDLVEAICLAHDLGHTPFGHAGQDALHHCMADHGGFEHNLQSLRVVDRLEERYPHYDGLNLTFETREGILKHCSKKNALMANVHESRLTITAGKDRLGLYQWNARIAKHYFCSRCGSYTFHQRRSDPDTYGVNVACLGLDPYRDFPDVAVVDGVHHARDTGEFRVAGRLTFELSPPPE